jgi:hypothetical protein
MRRNFTSLPRFQHSISYEFICVFWKRTIQQSQVSWQSKATQKRIIFSFKISFLFPSHLTYFMSPFLTSFNLSFIMNQQIYLSLSFHFSLDILRRFVQINFLIAVLNVHSCWFTLSVQIKLVEMENSLRMIRVESLHTNTHREVNFCVFWWMLRMKLDLFAH